MPFYSKNSGPVLITSCLCEKKYQALHILFRVLEQGSLGMRLCVRQLSATVMYHFMSSVCYRREERRVRKKRGEERRGEGGREKREEERRRKRGGK